MRSPLFFLSIACLLACGKLAFAGAWTQEPGSGQAIITASYYSTGDYFDKQGRRKSQPSYDQYALNPYLEYGLWDGFTAGTNLNLQRVHQDAVPENSGQTNWGLGDSEFFVRQRLWHKDGFAFSAEPMIKLPSPESSTATPRLGGSSVDAGLGLSAGYGFSAYGQNHFIDLDTQYRYRFGSPKDQINLAGTIGIGITPVLMLMPQVLLTYRASAPTTASFTESSGDDYNLVDSQLSTLYKLANGLSLQAGGFADINGKNTGGGGGALFAVWKNF